MGYVIQMKYSNDVLATPHREHVFSGNENDGDDMCPLCGALRPDTRHIMLSCGHPRMVELREDMSDKLRSIVFRNPHVHAIVGQYTPHPKHIRYTGRQTVSVCAGLSAGIRNKCAWPGEGGIA